MVRLIDTHAHLCDPAFGDDLDEVLDRARRAGVEGIVAVGEDLPDARRNLELAERFPGFIHPTAGLFPTILDIDAAEELERFVRKNGERWVAVGEVGLDRWKVQGEGERELQREIFSRFVGVALDLDLPLNVHSRSAGRKTIELLLEKGATRVQMHAFDGRAAKALPGVESGFYFSIPPSVIRSPQKQKLVSRLPLERLLVETDSPVLGVDRTRRNEPAAAIEALETIAGIKRLSIEEVGECVWENSLRLYSPRIEPRPASS